MAEKKSKPLGFWKGKQGLEKAKTVILNLYKELHHTLRYKDTPRGLTKAIRLGHWVDFGIHSYTDLIRFCGLKSYKADTMRTLFEFPDCIMGS